LNLLSTSWVLRAFHLFTCSGFPAGFTPIFSASILGVIYE